jgi:hypothetical protein
MAYSKAKLKSNGDKASHNESNTVINLQRTNNTDVRELKRTKAGQTPMT